MTKLKIAFVTPSYVNIGPTRQLAGIMKWMAVLGWEVHLVVLFGSVEWPVPSGVKVHALRQPSVNVVKQFINFRSKIANINADVVHSHGFVADLLCVVNRVRNHISTQRNNPFHDYIPKFGVPLGLPMACVHAVALRMARVCVLVSEHVSLGCRNEVVVYNGVDCGKYYPSQRETVENKISCLFAGPIIKRKRVRAAADVFLSLAGSHDSMRIAGEGPCAKDLSGIDDRIIMLGSVTDITQYLESANVYISMSASEGLPNAVLEAVSSGLFPVLSDIGPHRTIVNVLGEGVLLQSAGDVTEDLAEHIRECATEAGAAQRIHKKCAYTFDFKRCAARYASIYLYILGRRAASWSRLQ